MIACVYVCIAVFCILPFSNDVYVLTHIASAQYSLYMYEWCICMYVCVYVNIYVHILPVPHILHLYTCIYIWKYVCGYTCIYESISLYLYTYKPSVCEHTGNLHTHTQLYSCILTHAYKHTHIHMYIEIFTHKHTRTYTCSLCCHPCARGTHSHTHTHTYTH